MTTNSPRITSTCKCGTETIAYDVASFFRLRKEHQSVCPETMRTLVPASVTPDVRPDPDPQVVADEHEPALTAHFITCTCGWPTRQDFEVHESDWLPRFSLHLLHEAGMDVTA